MREAENSSKFPSGRSIALRRPGRAVAISMTPQLAGRRSAALWEAPLPCHLPPAALGLRRPRSLLTLTGLRLGDCGLPKVTPPAPRRARPGPILPARPSPAPPSSAAPRGPLPEHGGAGPGDPSKGARPSRHCRSLPAPQGLAPRRLRAAPAAHSPPRGLAASARRPGAGPCPSAAAEETLRGHGCWGGTRRCPSLPASLPPARPPLPAGAGTVTAQPCIRAAGLREAPALPLSRGPCGARPRWVGRGTRTRSRRGGALELRRLWGRCEESEMRVSSAQHHPPALGSAPGERGVTCRALPAPVRCWPPGLAPHLGTGRFVIVAQPLKAGSGVSHIL